MISYGELEKKWQKAWADAKVFEVEPNGKPGLLVTAAFPYVNSPQHIGHLRTYGTADTYARYKRMRGLNVLYPMGFHATGTPILAIAKRIVNKDKELIDELGRFHISDEDLEKMTDPVFIANYFVNEIGNGMRLTGLGIDWRRKFVSTEPMFSKMVEWQFGKLKEKGLLVQGEHPIGWCPNESNAVGQHDTLHDVQPEVEQVTAVKFREASGEAIFPCATYRPETLYGVTNLFVGKDVNYVLATVNGEKCYLSKDAADALVHQTNVSIEREIPVQELLEKKAINPINSEEVPILPGFFVKGDFGTGVVMSVPAHAPFDYVAIERLKAEGYAMPNIEYRKVLNVEKGASGASENASISMPLPKQDVKGTMSHPEIPALAYLELLNAAGANALNDTIELATKQLYREESRWGKMAIGKYVGMPEPEARDKIKEDLLSSNDAFVMYVMGNDSPVYCRCHTRAIVKVVKDQWFINYGNADWKKSVRSMFDTVKIYPERFRVTFGNVIDWIDLRATERAQGLGTRFPLNPEHIIESLSDSTIYMSLYTYIHILRSADVKPEQLKPEFFDYVYLSSGDPESVAKSTAIDSVTIRKCKESLDYWYADTSRHSGLDNLPGHLTMYVFTHVALFPEKFWPKQIVVNGLVNYEGQKMSKSLGNIVPLVDGLAKYGSDPLRFVEITGAELEIDSDFSINAIHGIDSRNEFLYKTVELLPSEHSRELTHLDYWLYSRLNSKIRDATVFMEQVGLKGAYTEIFYNSVSELKWYFERGGNNGIVIRDFLESVVLMLSPAMPHISEELWHMLGKQTLAAQEQWPVANDSMISAEDDGIEAIIRGVVEDVSQSIALTSKIDANKGKSISEIHIIVADDWKADAFNLLATTKSISKVMEDPSLKDVDKEKLRKFATQYAKRLQALMPLEKLNSEALLKGISEASEFLSGKFGAKVVVEQESQSKSQRAQRATQAKPAIDIIRG